MNNKTKKYNRRIITIIWILVIVLLIDLIIQFSVYQQLIKNIQVAEARLGMRTIEVSILDFIKSFYFPFRSPKMLNIYLKN